MEQNSNKKIPVGAISGLFSVSEDRKVYFSKGNLQFNSISYTWHFAENQWDTLSKEENENVCRSFNSYNDLYRFREYKLFDKLAEKLNYKVCIDRFAWGTSGFNHGGDEYQPWEAAFWTYDSYTRHHNAYGESYYSLHEKTGQADWGFNKIVNGGNKKGLWRTLRADEWAYLIFERKTPSGIRAAFASVNGRNGLLLLPDDWDPQIFSLFYWKKNDSFIERFSHKKSENNDRTENDDKFCNKDENPELRPESNTISIEDWQTKLEPAGCVFLPYSSSYYDNYRECNHSESIYWTSSCCDKKGTRELDRIKYGAWSFIFKYAECVGRNSLTGGEISIDPFTPRHESCSVRLVQDENVNIQEIDTNDDENANDSINSHCKNGDNEDGVSKNAETSSLLSLQQKTILISDQIETSKNRIIDFLESVPRIWWIIIVTAFILIYIIF